MRLTRLLAAGAALVAVAAGTTASSSAQVSVQLPNLTSGIKSLTGNVLPQLDKAAPVSSAPATQRMRIGLLVAHPHQAAENAALRAIYNPSSAHYHQFFTPQGYAKQFGVTPAAASAVRSWLTSHGLSIDYTSGARDYFLASGTVSQVQNLFATKLGLYSFKGASFLANASAPQVPARLHIVQVLGLNTFQRYHTMVQEAQARGALPAASSPNIGAQSPKDLWSIYQQPKNQTGRGVSVAILGNGATDSVIKDLHQFDRRTASTSCRCRLSTRRPTATTRTRAATRSGTSTCRRSTAWRPGSPRRFCTSRRRSRTPTSWRPPPPGSTTRTARRS